MIRILTSSDHAAFRDVRHQALRLHPVAFGTSAEAWANAAPEQTIAYMQDSESESPNVVLGSFEGRELTGMIGLRREARVSIDHKGSLWGFFVRPESRRRGHGSALVEEALTRAKQMDMHYVRIVATTTCVAALALFEAQGFRRYGLEPNGIKDDTDYYDQVFMLRPLDEEGARTA